MRKLAMAIVRWLGFWAHPVQAQLGDPFVFSDDDENTMPYRLFTPPTAEGGGELPLVVFLHVLQLIANDLDITGRMRSENPQSCTRSWLTSRITIGRKWFPECGRPSAVTS